MTTALIRFVEPWAVDDPRLDFLIYMHDMRESEVLRDAFMDEPAEPYNPDIQAPTERVLSPAPDGQVDWRKIGELLDLE